MSGPNDKLSDDEFSVESQEEKFRIIQEKTYKAMNPSSSTELEVRSDIVRDFETTSERGRREITEQSKMKKIKLPNALIARTDYQAAFDLLTSPK